MEQWQEVGGRGWAASSNDIAPHRQDPDSIVLPFISVEPQHKGSFRPNQEPTPLPDSVSSVNTIPAINFQIRAAIETAMRTGIEATNLPDGKGDVGRHIYVVDGPTFGLALFVYAAFFLLTANYHALPWWLVLPLGASTICLHGSLQHEAVHGYPFRWRWANHALIGWSLWLWLPLGSYIQTHLKHHRDQNITDPELDPESNYVTQAQWQKMSQPHRLLRRSMATLAGRLVLGPGYFTYVAIADALRAARRGDWLSVRPWAWHAATLVVILWWVIGICRIPFLEYVLFFAYPGTSMALLRSYAEHRASRDVKERTVICESGWFWNLMFLGNNLHALHHAEPGLVWHQRRSRYLVLKDKILTENGNYLMRGYGELAGRFLFKPKEPLIHPLIRTESPSAA
jgi:fatty acid desaturase